MTQPQHPSSLSAGEQRTLDNVLQRFRTVWKPGELQRWQDWLPKPGSALRLPMLLGLVRIDLHQHWQQGQRPTVESYLQRFPELSEHSQAETLLIQTEYAARSQAGMPVDVPAMARRFQLPVEQLQQLLGLPSPPPSTGTEEDEPATRLIARPAVPSTSTVALPAPRQAHAIRRSRRWLWWIAALPVLASLLLLGGMVYLATDHGTVEIALNDPDAQVAIQLDGSITLNDGERRVRLRPGEHGLVVTGKDYETVTRTFTVRRGKKTLVRVTLHSKVEPDAKPKEKLPDKENRGPIDLLAYVDVQRDALRGQWSRDGKALLCPALSPEQGSRSCLQVPFALPEEYDLTLVAQRTKNNNEWCLWFEMQQQRVRLLLDAFEGGTSGLEWVDGKRANNNATTWKGQVFPFGKAVQVDLSVRKNHIRVLSEGRMLIDWKGKPGQLQDRTRLPTTSCLALGSYQAAFRISRLSLRSVSGPREPATKSWTPDQLVARYVLLRGGAVEVTTKGGAVRCQQVDDLPTEPYRLRYVTLDRTDFRWDRHLAHLPAVDTLEVFRADHADFGNAAVSYLRKLKRLRELSVAGTRTTEKMLTDLGQLSQLRVLRVGEGQFAEKALKQFRAKLPKCQVKEVPADRVAAEAVLSYKGAAVSFRTAEGKEQKVRSMGQLPRTPFRVTYLALPQLTPVAGWRLRSIRNLPELQRLFFWGNSLRSADVLALDNLPKLQGLSLGANGIDERLVQHLSRFQNLRSLNLYWSRCTDACLKHLKGLKHLNDLQLGHTRITDAAMNHLAEMSSLQVLLLDGTRISNASVEQMVKFKNLKKLQVRKTRLTREGVARLKKALPLCKVVADNYEHSVKVWDTHTGQQTFTHTGHSGPVLSVAFSADGQRIVSGSYDKTVKVWHTRTGKELLTLKGHSRPVTSVAFRADGQHIISGSRGEVKVWDAATGKATLSFKGGVWSVAFSPDGKRIISGGGDGVKVWDLATGQATLSRKGHAGLVSGAALSADGKRGFTASLDKTVKVWDALTGKVAHTFKGHAGPVWDLGLSANDKHIVTASLDNTVKMWDTLTGKEVLTLKGHTGSVLSVAISADGKRIVSASVDRTVKLWDATTGKEVRSFQPHTDAVWSVALSPDSKHIVTAGYDPLVKASGTPTKETDPLTPEQRRDNLLRQGSFEGKPVKVWSAQSYVGNRQVASIVDNVSQSGKAAVRLHSPRLDDAGFYQKVAVKRNTRYLLCGWIKTEDVVVEKGSSRGATLSIWGGYESSQSLVGTNDWTRVALVFDSKDRREVQLGARLGHHASVAIGTAWFDDLCVVEIKDVAAK